MAITQVHKTTYQSAANATGHTNTFGWTAAAGNLLVACINAEATFSVTAGWTLAKTQLDFAQTDIWYKVAVGNETSLTVTLSSSAGALFGVTEWSGGTGTWKLDKVAGANVTSATASTGTTAATAFADELAIACFGSGGGGFSAYTGTPSASFTQEFNGVAHNGSNNMLYASKVLSATGAQVCTVTSASASTHHSSCIATFNVGPKTPIFVCGAECGIAVVGTLSAGTEHWSTVLTVGGTPAVVTSGPATMRSTRAFRFNTASGQNALRHTFAVAVASPATVVGRFYIYFASLPTNDIQLATAGNQNVGPFFRKSDNSIIAAASATNGTTGVTVTTGQWYRVDFKSVLGTTQTCDVQVDGVACSQVSKGASALAVSSFDIGNVSGGFTSDIYVDDICLSQTSTDYPIGEGTVAGLYPNGDGTHQGTWVSGAFGKGTGGATAATRTDTDLWTSLQKPLSTTIPSTFISALTTTSTADTVRLNLDNLPGTPTMVNGLAMVATTHSASATTSDFKLYRSDPAGGPSPGVNADLSETTITVPYFCSATDTGGGVLSVTDVNSTYVSFMSTDTNPDVYLDGVCVEVDYVAVVPDATASAIAVAATTTIPAATGTATNPDATADALVVAATATESLAVATGSATAAATTVVATATDPLATAAGGATAAALTQARTTTIGVATATGNAVASAISVARTATVPQATASGSTVVDATANAVTVAVIATDPLATATGGATATAQPVVATATESLATATGGATAAATVVPTTATVPLATATSGAAPVFANALAVAASSTIPAATATVDATAVAIAQARTVTIPLATATGGALAAALTVAATALDSLVTATSSMVAPVTAVAGTTTVSSLTGSTANTVTAVARTTTIGALTSAGGAAATALPVAATATAGAPSAAGGAVAAALAVTRTTTVGAVTASATTDAIAAALTVARTTTIGIPTGLTGTGAQAITVARSATVPVASGSVSSTVAGIAASVVRGTPTATGGAVGAAVTVARSATVPLASASAPNAIASAIAVVRTVTVNPVTGGTAIVALAIPVTSTTIRGIPTATGTVLAQSVAAQAHVSSILLTGVNPPLVAPACVVLSVSNVGQVALTVTKPYAVTLEVTELYELALTMKEC